MPNRTPNPTSKNVSSAATQRVAGRRQFKILDLTATLLLLHAAVTAVHFALLLVGSLEVRGSYQQLVEFAAADTVATIIPSIAGAIGIFRRRAWGWALSWLVVGGYLHGMVVLIVRGMHDDHPGVMPFIAWYFLAGSFALATVLARTRCAFPELRIGQQLSIRRHVARLRQKELTVLVDSIGLQEQLTADR